MTQALARLAGIKVVGVDRSKNEALVMAEESAASVDEMLAAIKSAGKFQAKLAA